MIVRRASAIDANAGSALLSRAIVELCVADHASDPTQMAAWVANKTSQMWLQWLSHTDSSLYVAEREGKLVGVCMMLHAGEILLNYVSPDARFGGVSKAMLARMEADARALGVSSMILESTRTARLFYLSAGYTTVADDGLMLRKRLGTPSVRSGAAP